MQSGAVQAIGCRVRGLGSHVGRQWPAARLSDQARLPGGKYRFGHFASRRLLSGRHWGVVEAEPDSRQPGEMGYCKRRLGNSATPGFGKSAKLLPRPTRLLEAALTGRSATSGAPGWYSAARNREGLASLRPDLDRITEIHSIGELIDVVATLHQRNMLLEGYLGLSAHARSSLSAWIRTNATAAAALSPSPKAGSRSAPRCTRNRSHAGRGGARGFGSISSRRFSGLYNDNAKAKASADTVVDLEPASARYLLRATRIER